MDINELYTKYKVLSDGLERRYLINAHDRRYDLDYATPIELIMLVDGKWECGDERFYTTNPIKKVFQSRSWVKLIQDLASYLQSKAPKQLNELLNFRVEWSKAAIFSTNKDFTNMVDIGESLYVSVNFTATHSTWIIGDLLNFYGVGFGYLVIHRPPATEPVEIREELRNLRKGEFKEYLMTGCKKDEERVNKIVNSIETLNKILTKMGGSYNDFFLFDTTLMLSTYKAKFLQSCNKYASWNDDQMKAIRRYLEYLTNFYTALMKEAKKNRNKLEVWVPIL